MGEGPVWDDREQCVYYVDITSHRVYRREGADLAQRTVVHEADRAVTCVLLAQDGGLLIVERDRLVTRSIDGVVRSGPPLPADALEADPQRRFNDGTIDPQGRLLIGTLHEGDVENQERLLRIDSAGHVETLARSLTLSNGLGFDPSGLRLYHADTLRNRVNVYDYATPTPVPVRSFVVEPGYPDGLTVDAEGFIWVAVWGGSEVRRYTPTGMLDAQLPVPARHVTAAAFMGDELVITTASEGVDDPLPVDGGVYSAHVGVRGATSYRWAGRTEA
nr:SMP-30/gluconolactonase/LRE family protein [Demequina oxidasica]